MVPPQSPSGICTLIQSDYEGPPTISLKYMYSYAIWLWWFPHNLPQVYVLLSNLTMRVPHNLPQVYVLLSNLTMRVPPQSPSGICTLIQSDYDDPPTISLRYMYSYPIWLWGSVPTISLRYMYSYPIWLWWSPHNLPQVQMYMYSYPIWIWGSPYNLPQVYHVLLSNLTMRVPPQSPSSICTLIQSNYEGPPQSPSGICSYSIWLWGSPTISLRYMYSYPI